MVKEKSEMPNMLKMPMGTISKVCKGLKGEKFHLCQSQLAHLCLPKRNEAEAFNVCLENEFKSLEAKNE